MIPIIIAARKQSHRCANKLLREFACNKSLLDICLEKFQNNKNVYLAGHESEFESYAIKYNTNFIQRNEESAQSEEAIVIHNYLKNYGFEHICLLNPCCPFIKASTIFDTIKTFERMDIKSLFTVKKSFELIFDSDYKIVNQDRLLNSKIRNCHYIGNNVAYVFNVDYLFDNHSYWDYTKNNPYLYVMDETESVDIDTERDFKLAQLLWSTNE